MKNNKTFRICMILLILALSSIVYSFEFITYDIEITDYENVQKYDNVRVCKSGFFHINTSYVCTSYDYELQPSKIVQEHSGVVYAGTRTFEFDGYFCRAYQNKIHCKSVSDGLHKGDEYATAICNNKGGESCMILELISNRSYSIRTANSKPIYTTPIKYSMTRFD